MKLERIPYQAYLPSDFACQLDLSEMERTVLLKIHQLDKGDVFGCHALVLTLAEYTQYSHVQVRGAIDRLRRKGYLVIMGFMPSSAACRRVKLKYAKIPGVKGASIITQEGERQIFRYRKTKEANPSICLREKMATPPSPEMPNTGDYSGNKPIIPCKQGMGSFSMKVETKPEPKPRKHSKDWVGMFNSLPGAQEVLKAFKLDSISPKVARMVWKRRQNLGIPGLLYLARNAVLLSDELKDPARRFIDLEDCLRRYVAIRIHICAKKKERLLCDLEQARDIMGESLGSVCDEMEAVITRVKSEGINTLDEYFEAGAHPRTAWFAAYYFHLRGVDIQSSAYWSHVGWSCVMRPEVFAFMCQHFKFDLSSLAGLTEAEAIALRADIELDLKKCRDTVCFCPSIKVLDAMESALSDTTFFTERVTRFLADGTYDRFSELLVA